ncbi:MAG: outer membrane lipoprotein-sorting protein [Spirochaetes bacterium]|nr:outer membrane lipoprotein-sorting protein [Spirochaetota bacterium]
MTKKLVLISILIAISFSLSADPKGEDIARKSFNLPEENDSYSMATMVLINSKGSKKIRKLAMYSKKTTKGTNSFVEFSEPADVKGSRFLTIGYDKGDDEQRLYLPALGKVRKISSSKKGGSFMGSDLNYFDMESRDFSDFQYQYLKDENLDNKNFYVIEMIPVDENAPYSRQIAWIAKDNYFIYQIECFDKDKTNQRIKTIAFLDVQKINGILTARRMVVDNHEKNHKTLLQMDEKKINIGIKENIFTIQNLTK